MGLTSHLNTFRRPSKQRSPSLAAHSTTTAAPTNQPQPSIASVNADTIVHEPPNPIPSSLAISFSKHHKVPSQITSPYSTSPLYLFNTQTILTPNVNLLRAVPTPTSIGTCTFPKKGSDTACVVHEAGFTVKPRSKVSSDWGFSGASGGEYILSGSRHGLDITGPSGAPVAVFKIFGEKNEDNEIMQKGTFDFLEAGVGLGELEKERVLFVALAVVEHKKQTNKTSWDSFGSTAYWSALGPG